MDHSPSPLPPELLFVDADRAADRYVATLRAQYRVTVTSTAGAALQALDRAAPALVVVDLDLREESSEAICRRAKGLLVPATVLVTTSEATRVPAALAAGCDAVLLKPFAPNLLYARLGRLLRARSVELVLRAQRQHAKAVHLKEQLEILTTGTNRQWPHTHCPYCQHHGVTSFEHASHRRSWYACMACSRVWIARRQE